MYLHLMMNTNEDIYSPPAVCSKAPSSAGITKCVTFTTSLLVSSWKSYCFEFICKVTTDSERLSNDLWLFSVEKKPSRLVREEQTT